MNVEDKRICMREAMISLIALAIVCVIAGPIFMTVKKLFDKRIQECSDTFKKTIDLLRNEE